MKIFLLVCALLAGHVRSQGADPGFAVEFGPQCLELRDIIPSLSDLCLYFKLHTCGTIGYHLNVTYGASIVINSDVQNAQQARYCLNPSGNCQTCLTWDDGPTSFVIEPNYAHLCTKVETKCTVAGLPIPPVTVRLGCVTLGVPCYQYKDCRSCNAIEDCGWCGSAATGEFGCKADNVQHTAPYCSQCTSPAPAKNWITTDFECPAPPAAPADMGMIIGVAVGCSAAVVILVVGGVLYRKKKKDEHTGVGGSRTGYRSDGIDTGEDDSQEMTHRINLPGGPSSSASATTSSSGHLQDVPLSSKSELKGS